jgi:hypothetical protein
LYAPARLKSIPVTDTTRAVLGVGLGLLIMSAAVRVFTVNTFDFDNMQKGVRLLLAGVNPWAAATRIADFYNPPFAMVFLWPMLFATPKIYLVAGGALLFGFVFYHRAWVALAWFATNTLLLLLAAGGIDLFVMGGGLLLLLAGDRLYARRLGLLLRVLAYGLLMVKPQGTIFIVALYVVTHRDWKGFLICCLIYGLPFLPLYPAWLNVIIHDPPISQTQARHTLLAQYGPLLAVAVAAGVVLKRRWHYWQLGGALAGILMTYGMPGLPIFLTLTAVQPLVAIPIVIIYSGCLAVLTWVAPPPGVDYYSFVNPHMGIYHLSMLGLAVALACLSPGPIGQGTIGIADWIKAHWPAHSTANAPI